MSQTVIVVALSGSGLAASASERHRLVAYVGTPRSKEAMATDTYTIDPAVRALLIDLGLSPANVLRRAGLPADLLTRGPVSLSASDYFSLWAAIEDEAGDANTPLRIAEKISAEVFDPPIFAALLSSNLENAARRIATYKRLIGPLRVDVASDDAGLTISCNWPTTADPPASLVLAELLFWVALARIGTRHRVEPVRIAAPQGPSDTAAYQRFLGINVTERRERTITFSNDDAKRPFLTANEALWEVFEPDLRRRLSDLETEATTSDRVTSLLLELLPAGDSTMEAVARHLAVSKRTLHRRLQAEGTTFQTLLNRTRESLARHYLTRPNISAGEISFLLGYEEPSSFYRAFQSWTGQTPERVRAETLT